MQNADLEDRLLIAFVVDDTRERIDLVVYHPAFTAMDERVWHVAYAALDTALGKDGVERWIGSIELVDDEPDGANPMAFLVEAVGALAQTATGEQIALLRADAPEGFPVVATVNLALKPIDHPACGFHVMVDIAFDADETGMPASQTETDVLDDLEDSLGLAIGDAVFVGRETGGGVRTIHFVAHAEPALDAWIAEHAGDREIEVATFEDPEWDFLRRFD